MGQDGIPISVVIIMATAILGVCFVMSMVLMAVFFS